MNAIITVVGSDKVGIIAKVSQFLSEHKINIADITQTILSGNFVMMMMVDLSGADIDIENLRSNMNKLAEEMGASPVRRCRRRATASGNKASCSGRA